MLSQRSHIFLESRPIVGLLLLLLSVRRGHHLTTVANRCNNLIKWLAVASLREEHVPRRTRQVQLRVNMVRVHRLSLTHHYGSTVDFRRLAVRRRQL